MPIHVFKKIVEIILPKLFLNFLEANDNINKITHRYITMDSTFIFQKNMWGN